MAKNLSQYPYLKQDANFFVLIIFLTLPILDKEVRLDEN